jgi:glycosyltransferase involved in cell wall biosynthesis
MKPVCFVLPDGQGLGGVTVWAMDMARMTAERGHAASLLEHANPSVFWGEEVADSVVHIECAGKHPAWANIDEVAAYAHAYRQALPATFVPNYTEGSYAACARASKEDPTQMRVLGYVHTDQPYYYELVEHYDPLIHLFVAVSEEIATTLAARLPHRADDIRIRPYGVAAPSRLERSWSDVSSPLQLTFAGRLVREQKRITDLIPLVEQLHAQSVDFRLRIAGEGCDEQELRAGLEALGPQASAKVEFVGRVSQDQMQQIWRTTDVAILVSAYEGTSIAMLESMAHGCVPVVTRVSGTSKAIQNGRNGFVVGIGDMRSMARRIRFLAESRQKLEAMGRDAHQGVLQHHSISRYVDWFEALVEESWQREPRGWPSDRPLMPKVRCGSPKPVPISPWGRCKRFYGKVRRRLNLEPGP